MHEKTINHFLIQEKYDENENILLYDYRRIRGG